MFEFEVVSFQYTTFLFLITYFALFYSQESISGPFLRVSSRIKRREVVATLNEEADVIDYVHCDPFDDGDDDYDDAHKVFLPGDAAQTSTPTKPVKGVQLKQHSVRGSATDTDSLPRAEVVYATVGGKQGI